MFDITNYGAAGIAEPRETLKLTGLVWKDWRFRPGIEAVVYHPREAGLPLDSVGIQKAIDAAHDAGGGTVAVPPGDYLIGPIRLRSRVTLHLEPGARLWGSPRLEDYRRGANSSIPTSIGHGCNVHKEMHIDELDFLISADAAEDVAITGQGQISGQSPVWAIPWLNSQPTERCHLRPSQMFLLHKCRRLRVEGIRILDAPAWTLVIDECDDVVIHGITIHDFDFLNADGIDLHASSNVRISDCHIHCQDDAICLKNVLPDVTMRNIVVTNCTIRTMCNGFKIGTDSLGNYENITVSNLTIANPDQDTKHAIGGINLCAVDGGFLRGVSISNIVMRNVRCPFYLVSGCRRDLQARHREPQIGRMQDIQISNIQADNSQYTPYVVGQPGVPIRGVSLSDIRIRKGRDFYEQPVTRPVPERPEQYPQPWIFSNRDAGDQLPAYGLYLRHVEDVLVRDYSVKLDLPDAREFMVSDDAQDVRNPEG